MKTAMMTVARVYKVTLGANLVSSITATQSLSGGRIKVEAVTDFEDTGGTIVFEPDSDTKREVAAYTGIDEATDELTGVTRPSPKSHAAGTFVQVEEEPVVEKLADGYLEGEEDSVVGVLIPPELWAYFPKGSRAPGEEEVVWCEDDSDGDVIISSAPVGQEPTIDADLELLPPVGGGDVGGIGGTTNPSSGYEDKVPPADAPTDIFFNAGVENFFIITFRTVNNSSAVTYKLFVDTVAGFAPSANTLAGTLALSGGEGMYSSITVRNFPTGHKLTGSPVVGTTYYAKVIASDRSGDGPVSSEVSGSPITVPADVMDGSLDMAKFAVGIRPPRVVTNLPTLPHSDYPVGDTVFLNKPSDTVNNGKLFRNVNNVWTAAVPAVDITGQLATAQLAVDSVTSAIIAAGAVTTTEISDGAISSAKITAGAITAGKIAAGAIVAADIAAGAITTAKLAAGAVTANEIAANSITSAKIAADTITAGNIAAGAISTSELAADAVIADKIAANTITAGEIATRTLTADRIVSGTLTATEISGTTITADKMSVTSLSAISANIGSITAGTVTGATIQTSSGNARVAMSDVSGENDRIKFYGSTGSLVGAIRAEGGDLYLNPVVSNGAYVACDYFRVRTGGITVQAGGIKWQGGLECNDTTQTNTNPSIAIGASGNQPLPGTGGTTAESRPATWLRVVRPTGTVGWIPVYS